MARALGSSWSVVPNTDAKGESDNTNIHTHKHINETTIAKM